MRVARAVLPALAAVLLLVVAPAQASVAGPVYSGTGWQIATKDGIHSLDTKDPYLFTFADSASRTRLTPYAQAVAAQLNDVTGLTFTVSTTIEAPPTSGCPAEHHLILGVKYRPSGIAGMSWAGNCYTNRPGQEDDHAAWGGVTWLDSEYWSTSSWFSSDPTVNTAKTKNAVTHEIGHLIGLDHPNQDLDGDGTVENFECAKTYYGYLPVMCSPNGGYNTTSGGGQFTSIDTPGLRQLVANYGLG
ncbi:hypothetical protein ACWEG1_06300 [Streptomyces bauhiniae]